MFTMAVVDASGINAQHVVECAWKDLCYKQKIGSFTDNKGGYVPKIKTKDTNILNGQE